MKKICTLLFALSLTVAMTGCQNTGKSFFGIIKGVVTHDDYEAAGRIVGEAAYMGYVVMKGDPKYAKYCEQAEQIYAALDNAESFDTASVNQIALEILQAALTDRYGYVKAVLITDGVRVGGVIADRLIMKDVSAEDATLYAKGLKAGIDAARASTPRSALDEAAAKAREKEEKEKAKKEAEANGEKYVEKDEWERPIYITCSPVKTCTYKFTNRTTEVQLRLAKELDVFGFIDPNEVAPGEFDCTKYKNVKDFIARCENMQKYGVKKLRVWISDVRVDCKWKTDESGKEITDDKGNRIADCKLEAITFLWEDDYGNVMETDCVGCMADMELYDLIGPLGN